MATQAGITPEDIEYLYTGPLFIFDGETRTEVIFEADTKEESEDASG